ncbi:hypothetical protein [Bdellovibrio sp. HCB-162]|uniref:hypothetical protein n=1 Tax=Bdellovibrio sp. HCB-162 TaxID=3394234 RepID=UPI0039BD272F
MKKKMKHNVSSVKGNLDSEILVVNSAFRAEENPSLLPANQKVLQLKDLKVGEVITAEIPESLIAFPDSKVPVRAKISSGPLKGGIFIGEASLEKNSKRIVVDFKKFRAANSEEIYSVIASALDAKGILGIEGKYISNEAKYFGAEFLAAGAAGYADATIERNQNAFGNYVEDKSLDTVNKKAIASALTKTADRFAEKLKNAPEYSMLEGPIAIKILTY